MNKTKTETKDLTASPVDALVSVPVVTEEQTFDIPENIAVCCDCKKPVTAHVDGWVIEDEENDLWKANSVSVDCEDWEECIKLRNRGSYEDAITMSNRILKWLNGKYRWNG